jgi:hypothetical protein
MLCDCFRRSLTRTEIENRITNLGWIELETPQSVVCLITCRCGWTTSLEVSCSCRDLDQNEQDVLMSEVYAAAIQLQRAPVAGASYRSMTPYFRMQLGLDDEQPQAGRRAA